MPYFYLIISLLSLVLKFDLSLGHANGAPTQSCLTMQPGHLGHKPQPLASAVHKLEFAPYKEGLVLVKLASADRTGFKGFFVQARSISSGDANPVGKWTINNGLAKTIDCGGNENVAVTHSNNSLKESVSLVWSPPKQDAKIVFVASVVKEFSVFWVGIQSLTLVVTANHPESSTSASLLNSTSKTLLIPGSPKTSLEEKDEEKLNVSTTAIANRTNTLDLANNNNNNDSNVDNQANNGLGHLIEHEHYVYFKFLMGLLVVIVANFLVSS